MNGEGWGPEKHLKLCHIPPSERRVSRVENIDFRRGKGGKNATSDWLISSEISPRCTFVKNVTTSPNVGDNAIRNGFVSRPYRWRTPMAPINQSVLVIARRLAPERIIFIGFLAF